MESTVTWQARSNTGANSFSDEWKIGWEGVEKRRGLRKPSRACTRLFPLALFLFDVAIWGTLYFLVSVFLASANTYGIDELTVPVAVMAISLSLVGGYKSRTDMVSLQYAAEHCIACLAGMVVAAVALYLVSSFGARHNSSRGVFLAASMGFCAASLLCRRLLFLALSRRLPKRSLLIVADADRAAEFFRALRSHGQSQKLEFLATDPDLVGWRVDGPDSPVFSASAHDLPHILHADPELMHESIIVAADGSKLDPAFLGFLSTVHFQDLPVYSVQGFYEAYWQKMPLYLLRPTWPLQAGFHLVKHSAFAAAKRASDVAVSALALVLLFPAFAAVALAVKLDSSGPAFFRQTRIGQHRRPFTIYKFRTMRVGSETKGMYTETCDSRVTRIGRLLRASRLDELPQIYNVLRGDMSLIGPRAEWDKCVEQYENIIPHYHFRHLVRPGITGWAQVNYPYGANIRDTAEKLMYDLYYIRNFSLQLDAAVVLKTIHVMLFGKGR